MNRRFVLSIALVLAVLASTLTSVAPSEHVFATESWAGCWYDQEDMPTARWAMAAVELDGKIYVIGGRYGDPRFEVVERYDPAIDSWETMAPMPTPRAWLVAEAVNGKIYAIGGSDGGPDKLDTVEEYDPLTNTWATKAPMPSRRDDAVSGVVGGKIYVMGGWSGGALDDVEVYDPALNSWTGRANMPYSVAMASSAVVGDKIYVMGGKNDVGPLADAYEYTPATDTWVPKASMGVARMRLSAAAIGGAIYVVGGKNPTLGWLDTVQAYFPGTNAWMTLNSMPTRRGDLAAAAANDGSKDMVYVFGGHRDWDTGVLADTEAVDFSCGNNPPDVPTAPTPGNWADPVAFDANLGWSVIDPNGDSLTNDVYFGEAAASPSHTTPPLVSGEQSGKSYDPPATLKPLTRYYWRIVTTDSNDAVTAGPRWTFKTGEGPYIEVVKTASPPVLGEPGGPVEFTVQVTNAGSEAVTLQSLVDDPYGDLNGQGSCILTQTLAPGGVYTCAFTAAVSGDSGDEVTDTVTATAETGSGAVGVGQGSATVEITDVTPTIVVSKEAAPVSLPEPGGTFTFTVQVSNTSSETLTLESLVDDVFGNLDDQGDCSLPQDIDAAGSYSCAFGGEVSGNAGLKHTDTVTATVKDDENNIVKDADSAVVEITDALPSVTLLKTAAPTNVPAPGGTVTFTTVITNTGVETLTLLALVDDVYGDVDGQGACSLPQLLGVGLAYSCAFTGTVSGEDGTIHTDTITATVRDDEDNFVYVSASAKVEIGDVDYPVFLPFVTSKYTFPVSGVNRGDGASGQLQDPFEDVLGVILSALRTGIVGSGLFR